MALREYEWRGRTWQFDDADAPADAVPVAERRPEPAKPAAKAKAAANKARTARNKAVTAG